jgi:hypothetical protein
MKKIALSVALTAWALMLAGTAAGQSRDWTGYYTLATGREVPAPFKSINENLHDVIVAHLQPWAKLKMEATDGIADDTGQLCQLTGVFRNPPFAGSFLWLPGPDKIVIVYGALNTAGVQRVYLDRPHPKTLLPTWNGHSIGRWEGDTLVVDTIGFNDKSWLQPTMEPHTEEARLTQRIRQVANGTFIEIQYTVEDWKALTSAYTYTRYYKRVGEFMRETVCNDDLDIWRDFRNAKRKPLIERSREVREP